VIGDHLLPHRVRPVASVEAVDDYGNPVRVPDARGAEVPAYVQPLDTSEALADGQVRETRLKVFVRPDVTGLDAWSHLVWEGREYELEGDPRRHDSPAGPHHRVLYVRRVGA